MENKEASMGSIVITSDDTKATIRTKIWDFIEANKLSSSSWPPHKKIPNYKIAKETAERLRELDLFKSASTIKIDPDKPLQQLRYFALQDGKVIFVPVPRLASYFMNKVEPLGDSKLNWDCSKAGLLKHATMVEMEKKQKVDLIVVGAVAVSSKGWRIGKGMGFSDIEYAMMRQLDFVDNNTKIVACVHDCQVIENMPDDIFQQHDAPIDIIVTPTRVIDCKGAGIDRPRPQEVFWHMLTSAQLNSIPALKKLRYMEWMKTGSIKCLMDETEAPSKLQDVELKIPEKKIRPKYSGASNRKADRSGGSAVNARGGAKESEGRKVRQRKTNNIDHDGSGDMAKDVDSSKRSGSSSEGKPPRKFVFNERRQKKSRTFSGQGQSWLYIGNIPWNIRVSEFKQQIRDVIKMQPLRVVWRGSYGFSFLNFSKASEAKEALLKLEGIKILNRQLKVELAQKKERKYSSGREEKVVSKVEKSKEDVKVKIESSESVDLAEKLEATVKVED